MMNRFGSFGRALLASSVVVSLSLPACAGIAEEPATEPPTTGETLIPPTTMVLDGTVTGEHLVDIEEVSDDVWVMTFSTEVLEQVAIEEG